MIYDTLDTYVIEFYQIINWTLTISLVFKRLEIFNTFFIFMSWYFLYVIFLRINDERYSQMIAEWFTSVSIETKASYRRSSYYDGVRLSRDDQNLVCSLLYELH